MTRRRGRPPVEVVGHGGAGGHHPGNSRPAMELALALGVDRIECDVRRAACGELVLVHDDALRLPDGRRRRVEALTVAELHDLLPGLMTFDELAELAARRVPLLIDVKRPGYEPDVLAAIRRHRLQEASSLSCTWLSTLGRLRRELPTMRLGFSTGHWATGTPTPAGRALARGALRLLLPLPLLAIVRAVGLTDVMLQHRLATAPLVAALHAAGCQINLWTVDDPKAIRRALRLEVDAIISNRPDVVRREAYGAGGDGDERR